MLCLLHTPAPGHTMPVTPPLRSLSPGCWCQPDPTAQSPFVSLQLMSLWWLPHVLSPQTCSPSPMCWPFLHSCPVLVAGTPRPPMYVRAHPCVYMMWILGDAGSTSFFIRLQLCGPSQPASASSSAPFRCEKPGCREWARSRPRPGLLSPTRDQASPAGRDGVMQGGLWRLARHCRPGAGGLSA